MLNVVDTELTFCLLFICQPDFAVNKESRLIFFNLFLKGRFMYLNVRSSCFYEYLLLDHPVQPFSLGLVKINYFLSCSLHTRTIHHDKFEVCTLNTFCNISSEKNQKPTEYQKYSETFG